MIFNGKLLQTTIKIFIFLLFCGFVIIDNSCASSVEVFKKNITLHEKKATFSHIIKAIEDLTDIKITVRGVEPNERRDVSINDRAFDKAIPQILHLFGVQNHSAIYYTKPQHRIELLLVGADYIQPGRADNTEFKSITAADFNRLKSTDTEEFKTLTNEHFSLLSVESAGQFKELSSVDFSRLPSESANEFKELSSEDFSRLPSKSAEEIRQLPGEERNKLEP